MTSLNLSAKSYDIVHRIGGGEVDNLRLKPKEKELNPPGISVLGGGTPQNASRQIREAFPQATILHELAKTVGTATIKDIKAVGFEIMPDSTKKFPNHIRIIHPDGIGGFTDYQLQKLSKVFQNTSVE